MLVLAKYAGAIYQIYAIAHCKNHYICNLSITDSQLMVS